MTRRIARRIVHLGTGNFHRAHQAWYTQHAVDLGQEWTITGVSFRSRTVPDLLNAQGGDYTLVQQGRNGTEFQRICVIDEVLFAPDDPARVVAAIAEPDTHIVSLTITEKGYTPAAEDAAGVRDGALPSSAIGHLACGLARRNAPLTVLCCDNLSDNGATLSRAVDTFCEAAGLTVTVTVTYPNTMVDRITPATTDALKKSVAQATGWADQGPVETETFSEWVIENRFAGPRPEWGKVGVQIVEDASPFELRKLRLLNGSHSALAYAGILAGHEYVHQAIQDPNLHDLACGIFDEAAATLPSGMETHDYRTALLERFANPSLNHRLRQIAMDGTQKLPVRLLGTIAERAGDAPWCRKAVEAWMSFAMTETDAGHILDDPKAEEIAKACASTDPKAALGALIGYTA